MLFEVSLRQNIIGIWIEPKWPINQAIGYAILGGANTDGFAIGDNGNDIFIRVNIVLSIGWDPWGFT